MRARGVVRVVGLIRMRHNAIRERGIDRRGRKRRARDRRRALSAVRADVALRRLPGQQFRSGDHRRQGIEQMVFGMLGGRRVLNPAARPTHEVRSGLIGCSKRNLT